MTNTFKGIETDAEAGTTSNTTTDESSHDDAWQEEFLPKLTISSLFQGWTGTLVMGFGVVIPALLVSLFALTCSHRLTLMLFDHPLETLAELLFVVNIPISIYIAWSTLIRNGNSYSVLRGINLGAAIGSAAIVSAVCIGVSAITAGSNMCSGVLDNFAVLSGWISVPWLLAAAAGVFVADKIRCTRDFSSSRARVVALTGAGFALSVLTFVTAEAKPWCIRLAERAAVSSVPEEQREGLKRLQSFYPEREMLIECSDARASGLCGLFLPLSPSSQRELYFAMTGEPFSFRDIHNNDLASISDESLAQQVVGDQIAELSLLRSSMTGVIHPETLSSTIDWTFVFKNDGTNSSEARAEIAIPRGAVVTRLTLWSHGKPYNAKLSDPHSTGYPGWTTQPNSEEVGSWIHDLGHGRMLVICSGVPAQNELRLQLSTVVPMEPNEAQTATLALPRFIATNFDLSGEHRLRLRSPCPVSSAWDKLKISSKATGERLITASLSAKDLTRSDFMLTSARPEIAGPIAAEDTLPFPPNVNSNNHSSYIVQTIKQVPARIPAQLVVLLDGSAKMDKYRSGLAESLKKLPKDVPTSIIVATSERGTEDELITVAEAIAKLQANKFACGQDNVKAMIKAAELAGESKNGAVLWIHGPQPASNHEIYIMGQYDARPNFYELSIEGGDTDNNELFRNYSEIGPFEQVPRNSSLVSDLQHFFAKWKPGSIDYVVELSRTSTIPHSTKLVSNQSSKELGALWANANQESLKYFVKNQIKAPAKTELEPRLVARAGAAILLPKSIKQADNDVSGIQASTAATENQEDNAAQLQLQRPNAFWVSGVYTAGAVRVNNLANLEALLNIFANGVEIVGLLTGLILFIQALAASDRNSEQSAKGQPPRMQLGRFGKMAMAAACIAGGLMTPGLINWFWGSARDANLFS